MVETSYALALPALIDALKRLPGVGEKSAQRMAFHLLQNDREAALGLADALRTACQRIRHCRECHTLCEDELCTICQNPDRDASQLCVLETPADQWAMENMRMYCGKYFVLLSKINFSHGVSEQQSGLERLFKRCADESVKEVIIATNFTADGEVAAHMIASHLKEAGLKVTRLAKGIPAGSELEYVDLSTIAHAYVDRN